MDTRQGGRAPGGRWSKTVVFATMVVLVMVLGIPRAMAAPGPLVNGSLETDANGDGVPDCFTNGGFGTNSVAFARVADHHTGSWGERVRITAYTDGDRKLVPSMVPGCAPAATPGEKYTVSVWYHSTVPAAFVMYALRPTGWDYWFDGTVAPASSTYKRVTQDLPPIPSDVTAVSFGLAIYSVGEVVTDDYGIATTGPPPTTSTTTTTRTTTTRTTTTSTSTSTSTTTTTAPGACPSGYVALTYDDGPGPQTTTLLDSLAARHARATFFVVGQMIDSSTAPVVTREARDGHVLGNHTWSHPHLTQLTDSQVRDELTQDNDQLVALGVPRPNLWRPPYSDADDRVDAVATSLGMTKTLFEVDTGDADDPGVSVEETRRRAVEGARSGSIIIMHDLVANSVAATPAIIDGLRARGFCLGVVRPSTTFSTQNHSYVAIVP